MLEMLSLTPYTLPKREVQIFAQNIFLSYSTYLYIIFVYKRSTNGSNIFFAAMNDLRDNVWNHSSS